MGVRATAVVLIVIIKRLDTADLQVQRWWWLSWCRRGQSPERLCIYNIHNDELHVAKRSTQRRSYAIFSHVSFIQGTRDCFGLILTTGCTAMKFCIDLPGAHRMNHTNFRHPLSLLLEMSWQLLEGLSYNLLQAFIFLTGSFELSFVISFSWVWFIERHPYSTPLLLFCLNWFAFCLRFVSLYSEFLGSTVNSGKVWWPFISFLTLCRLNNC